MVSADIGVAEGASTSAGTSLQLTGIGSTYEDFAWEAEVAASFGTINAGMLFGSCGGEMLCDVCALYVPDETLTRDLVDDAV